MAANPCALIALVAYLVAIVFLLTYRKAGARHRQGVSWLAWLLLVTLAGSVIDIAYAPRLVGLFDAARAVLLSLFVIGAGGNVARLLRSAP